MQRREADLTRIILHIGPHKTGTTYIQETLHALRDTLAEVGIHVPSVWSAAPGLPSHMRLVWAVRGGDLSLVREQLSEMSSRAYSAIVISCEALSRLDLEQVRTLRHLFGAASVRVVYYVRRWPERLPSLWQEAVKFGHSATLDEFLAGQLARCAGAEWLDLPKIETFAAVFGSERIGIVDYSHLTDHGIDIAGHFLASFLDLPDIGLPAAGRPNASLPIPDIELIRALNAIHMSRGGERSPALRDWFLAHRRDLGVEAIADAMRESLGSVRLDEAAWPFALASGDLLARYGSSFVTPREAGTSHAPRAVDVPFVRQDYLLQPGMATMLGEIHDTYRRQIDRD